MSDCEHPSRLPMSSGASVTLIALAFNHARYLPQLFSSISENIDDIREVIFIDNGSTDQSASLIQQYVDSVRHRVAVQIFCNPPRTGVTYAVNVALFAATSEHIAVTSGDDFLLPNRFTAQLAAMRAEPDVEFCYSNGYVCDDEGIMSRVPVHNKSTVSLLRYPPASIAARLYYPVPTLFTQCALFRRRALLEVGGWDEDLTIDDWPLNLKLFTRYGSNFRYVDAFVAAYRRHSMNASKRRFRQYFGQKRVLEKYARGTDLDQGMFALFASQGLASVKRRQWFRAKTFAGAALRKHPGVPFIIHWFSNEVRRRLGSHQIR